MLTRDYNLAPLVHTCDYGAVGLRSLGFLVLLYLKEYLCVHFYLIINLLFLTIYSLFISSWYQSEVLLQNRLLCLSSRSVILTLE